MADLSAFEPPAERLRRCDGDTEPQSACFLSYPGGSAPPFGFSRPAVKGTR